MSELKNLSKAELEFLLICVTIKKNRKPAQTMTIKKDNNNSSISREGVIMDNSNNVFNPRKRLPNSYVPVFLNNMDNDLSLSVLSSKEGNIMAAAIMTSIGVFDRVAAIENSCNNDQDIFYFNLIYERYSGMSIDAILPNYNVNIFDVGNFKLLDTISRYILSKSISKDIINEKVMPITEKLCRRGSNKMANKPELDPDINTNGTILIPRNLAINVLNKIGRYIKYPYKLSYADSTCTALILSYYNINNFEIDRKIIDLGITTGEGLSIGYIIDNNGREVYDWVSVDKRPELLENVLMPNYKLSEQEYMLTANDYPYSQVYDMIDFSDLISNEKIHKLDINERQLFLSNLLSIKGLPWRAYSYNVPALHINTFTDPNNFTLTSDGVVVDNYVISCTKIEPGLFVSCINGNINVVYKGMPVNMNFDPMTFTNFYQQVNPNFVNDIIKE
jgi:hypothetical protein